MNRKFALSKKIEVKEFAGSMVAMYVLDDLDDQQLQNQYDHFGEAEDWEYLEFIAAEAKRRNLKLQTHFI